MGRPQDWSALGMHGDPTPGDPDTLSSLYQGLRDTEHLGEEITSGLNRILDQSGNGFIGKTAGAVREKIDGHLKQFIDAIGKSFSLAADAAMAYRNALVDAQFKADQALSGAQGLSKDDPQLAAHKAQAHTAQDEYRSAVKVFQQRMRDAEHEIRQPIDAWHLFLKSLGILEIILAIVGAIFGGWIGLLAFGLGMVMFISSLVDFAQGKAGVLDVVLAFVGILFPSTKGLNVGALAKGLFNALKNLPKSLSAGLTDIGGGLTHLLTAGITFKGIYSGVTALPGLVLRGLNGLADLAVKGAKITVSGLKLLANTFRTDFHVATAGINTTLGKVAVYPISFGGRLVLGAVLPVDFFELAVGFKGAFKMGFGTRLLTPTAHLPQTALGGGLHIGALTGGHGGLTGLPTGVSFDGFGHGTLSGITPGGLHGLNTGIDAQFGGLHGISLGTDIGGINSGLTSLHTLDGAGHSNSVGNLMANTGGLNSVDHLTAFDHATGFQRTTAGLLEPLPTNLGGTGLAGAHHLSDLGSTGLHALRGDLTPSGTGLHASFSDAMSSVRVATGHVEDFHALGVPELRSIVDGDISGIRMTHDGISMQVGAQSGTPTTLHVDYRGTAVTNGEGKQVVVAPEVHEAIGTADIMATHGAGSGPQLTPPTVTTGHVTTGHVTTDVKAGATPTAAVTTDMKAGALNTSAVTTDAKAGSLDASAVTVDVKPGRLNTSAVTVDVKAGAAADIKAGTVVPSSGGDVKAGSAGGPSTGSVKGGGGTAGQPTGGATTDVRDLDGLAGGVRGTGAPERLAEEPVSPSVTAQGDRLGVSARADLDLLGQREGTGDTAGAAATTHVKTGAGTPPTGAVRVLDDGSGAVVVGEHIALRPTPAPVPKPGPHAAGGRPAPLSKFEAVTGGVTGKTGAERLTAWNEYELASATVADAKRQLDATGGKIGEPSETVDQAAAKLDLQHAEGAVDIAKGKMARLGMDIETIEGHLDALGIPGPRPSRLAGAPTGDGAGTAAKSTADGATAKAAGDGASAKAAGDGASAKATADGTGVGTKTGGGAAPGTLGKSLPFSPGEIERFWGLDGERVDALFGGPHDPLSGDRRQLWREFTETRYDVGRLEGQVRGDQPHAGGSSGPSAHELKLRQELSAAQANLDDLRRQLDELGVDSAHMDRQLWDLHAQSLKERPRLDGAGVRGTASSSHAAGDMPKLDDLMTEHQAAVKGMPKAESAAAQAQSSYDAKAAKLKQQQEKFDQLPPGTNERALQKAKKDLDKAQADLDKVKPGLDAALTELKKAQDALQKAKDDLAAGVDLHVVARDLTQRDVQRYVEKFAAEGHLDLAGVLRTHAEELTRVTRADLGTGGPVRWDQIALTGQEVKQQAGQVLTQAKDLERLLGPVTKSGHMDSVEVKVTAELKDAARGLEQSADSLGKMLEKGFIKDAASVGGVYGLRAEHGPLSFTAGKLAQRVNHAIENAVPGDVVRVDGVFNTEKAVADFHELGQAVRKFRSDKAYQDVPTGTQWKTVLPGRDEDWKKLYGSLDKLTPEQQQKFVRDLSEKNLTKLDSEVESLLKQHPDQEQALRGLLDNLKGLDYRIKHATPAYHAIANSGLMSSQGDLARRDVKFLASGKSSVKNTSSLGNDDFVFFRMDVGDAPMATRYGPTTLVFDAKVLKEHGGWVSLHDQLHPLDRPAMQKLEVKQKPAAPGESPTSKVFRSAEYDSGFEKIGEHAQWTYKYPQNGDLTRTVTFEKEVFHGEHVTDALALSVVREVIFMGSEYTELALKMSTDDLGRLVSKLFRPEAKFGSGLPITPKAVDGLSQGERNLLGVGPEPLHVHDPDGDGRYFSDGTMDPIGRWSGKHADAADDAFRSAEHGVQENNTVKIDAHLKEAKASIEKSIELTKGWKLNNPERQELIEHLLEKRESLLKRIEHLQSDWKAEVKRLHGDKTGTGETPKPKGTSPKDGAVKAPKDASPKASKDGAAQAPKGGAVKSPKPSQASGPKASGKPKAPAGKAGVPPVSGDASVTAADVQVKTPDVQVRTADGQVKTVPGAGESRPIADIQLPAPKAVGTAVTEPKAPAAEATPSGPAEPPRSSGLEGSGSSSATPPETPGIKVSESSVTTPSETPAVKVSESVAAKADVSVGQAPERAVEAEAHDVPHVHTSPDTNAAADVHAMPDVHASSGAHTAADVHAMPDAHAAPDAHGAAGGAQGGFKAAGSDARTGRVERSAGAKGERRPDMLDPAVFKQHTSTLTGVRSWSEIQVLDELLHAYQAVPEPDVARRVDVLRELESKAERYLAGEPDPQRIPGVELLKVQVGFELDSLSHAVRGAQPTSVERLTAGDVARLWNEDGRRADALFGGPQHPSYDERVAAWGKLTQARYDVGRLEGQARGGQPHAGGSGGPSAHEVQIRQDLTAANAHLDSARQDLVRLGIDPDRVDRDLSALYAQSLKERPRAVAGGHQPAPHPAAEPQHAWDNLLAEHTKATGQVPSAKVRLEDATVARDGALAKSQAAREKFDALKSEYDQLPEPTKQQTRQYQKTQKEAETEEKNYQTQQAKFDARKAELDAADAKVAQAWRALDGAVDDVVRAGTHSQRELSRLVDTFAGAADVEHAARLHRHARALDVSARRGLDGPDARPDQVLWTGKDIEDQAKRIRVQAAELEQELADGSKARPADVQAQVDQLRASVGQLHGMLDGFITDAAPHGGVYALRNTHGPLALAAGHLVDLADDALGKAGPDTAVRLTEPFNTHKAAEGLRNGATHWLRDFRTGKAYADVPTGTQWQAVLPGSEGQWKAVFGDIDKLTSRQTTPANELSQAELKSLREGIAQQEAFVQTLSRKNIENLRQEIDALIAKMPPERQEAFRALKQRLLDLPYRVKHATPAYHAIANSGVMSSQGDLARRNVKHLASGKSSANNTTNLGNDDFVFFRMEVGDGAMASRYGPTTLVFDAKVLEEHGGWVSLHDQLHPLDRQTMRELSLDEKMAPTQGPDGKVFRTGRYDEGFTDIGKRAQWTHTYPQNSGASRTVTFEQEVFHGQHVVEALALSVIREVDSIGGAFPAHVLGLDTEGLGKVVSQLFRPEAKFGSGLPITPMNAVVHHGMPQPLRVVNEHGDGRYFPDGTIDPVARAAGKQHDMASDALRQADNSKATGHDGKAKDHLKDAKAHAQQSIDLTKTFQEGSTGERRDLATKLLEERTELFQHIDTKLKNWQGTDHAPTAKPSGAKGPSAKGTSGPKAPGPKAAGPKASGSKASGSKTPAVQGAGTTLPDAEATRLHTALSPLFGDKTTPDLVSVARGLVEHGDLNAPTEAGKTFGLSKRAYDKVSKDLEGKGLVRRVNGGLLLTEQGGHLLLPPSPDGLAVKPVREAEPTGVGEHDLPNPTGVGEHDLPNPVGPKEHTGPADGPSGHDVPESVPASTDLVRPSDAGVAQVPDRTVTDHHTAPVTHLDTQGPRLADDPHAPAAPAREAVAQSASGAPLSSPVRMTVSGQIGGADRVLPSQEAAATVSRDLVAHFDGVLTPAQRDALRSDLQAQLGREVWPSLSVMTRGETRTLTVDVAGFSGDITVRAEVTKAEPDGAFKSLEFEDGSESLVRDGFQRETRSVVTAGVLVKGKAAAQTDLTGHLSSNWSRTESHRTTSSGRLFSRTKTPEPALKLDVEVRLEFDVSAVSGPAGKHLVPDSADGTRPGRVEVSAKVPVAVAEGDVRPASAMQHYLPPARVEQTLALGGMDTVRDVFLVNADGERVSGTLHKALLGSAADPHSLESYGKRAFGDRWPAVRELVLDRIGSLDALQYRLKGMTAGEALEIDLGPEAGSMLVTAEVTTMKHLRNTDKTEFNTGSDVTRVYTHTRSSEHGVRATMQAQSADLHAGPTTVTGVGHGEFDRDGALTVQESVRTGTAVKMKVPGAVFDGVATLSFVHRADPLGAPAPARAAASATAPGHAAPVAPSATAPGHAAPVAPSATAPGHAAPVAPSATAPGHAAPAAPSATAPGHAAPVAPSATAPGHATPSAASAPAPAHAAPSATPVPAPAHAAPSTPDTGRAPRPATDLPPGGRVQLGFQVLVDAADARPVGEPGVFSAATRPQGPRRMAAPALQEGDHAWRPAPGVWDGLPSRTVVLDVLSGEERALGAAPSPRLADLVDGAGREHFGADWADVCPAAHDMATREQLAATLPQLTRGTTARSTPLPTPLRSNAQLSLSGRLESLEYVRTLDAAELNLLSDVADETGGRLGSALGHGQLAQGGVQPELGGDVTLAVHAPGGGIAHRSRTADGASGGHSSAAGAKYPEPMAVYIATVGVDAHVGRVGESTTHGGRTDVRFVVAIPKSHTQRYEVTKEAAGSQVFHRPESAAPPHPGPAGTAPDELTVRPPLRVSDSGRIGNGDAVLELPGDKVVKELERQLSGAFGERWGQVEGELARFFDSIALQPRTAGLTAGDTWGDTFRAGPVTADIRITAADARMTEYLRVEKNFEFEQGTESAAAASVQKDTHVRRTLWERAGFKAPHVTFTLGHVRHNESVAGHGIDVRGGVVAKNKTVEPAAVFKGEVTYTVEVKISHPLPGRGGERTFTVTNDGEFAFPVRDLPADPATGAAHRPDQYRRVPDRIAGSLRLSAEDVVLDTRPVRGDTAGTRLVEDVLRQLDPNGPTLFGSAADWKAARAKLAERLPASEFQRRLKSIMAGQPWVVRVNGRELALRASVKEMTHTADTEATEFNSATVDGTGGGRTESGLTGPQITSDGTNVTVVGTSDPIGGSPAEVFGGGTLAHTTQSEHLADSSTGIRSTAGTKTKVPGSVYDGVARLHIEVRDRWRPFGRGVDTRVPKEAVDEQLRFKGLREEVVGLQRQFDEASAAGRPQHELDALTQRLDGARASFDKGLTDHTTRIREAVDTRRTGRGTLGFTPMTRRTFGVRVRGVGEAEIGFQALLPTADTVRAAGPHEAHFTAPELGAGRPRPARRPGTAPGQSEVPRPPESLLTHGMSDGQLVRDLPDVQSLRGLLDHQGGKVFGRAWSDVTRTGQRRGEMVMGGFTKDRLMAALPELTRGAELRGESFRVNGREAWVSVRAEVLDLTHTRPEPKAEVALATEKSYVFGRRDLHSRQFFLLGQVGAVAGTLESKLGAAVTFGGGFRRRTRGDQLTGGRTFTNAKIPKPLEHYDGHVEFTFTFHLGGTRTEASGVVPVGLSVPSAQITEHVLVDQGHVFTRAAPAEHPPVRTQTVGHPDSTANNSAPPAGEHVTDAGPLTTRPLDKGKQRAEFTVDENEAVDAGAALSDARRLRAEAERVLSEMQRRQDTGVGGVADSDGTRRALAQAQLERAEAAEILAEAHWSEVTGGRPLPFAVSREGAVPGLGGGAPHWARSPRSGARGAAAASKGPEGTVVSVEHIPSASHVVFDTDEGEAYALVPGGPDLTVAHWVSDPASAHGRPADPAADQEAYAGDIAVQRQLLDKALTAAEGTSQLKKVLQRQVTSFEEDVRLFRVLEDRTSLRKLAPAQLVAVVLAERRALRTLPADWDRLAANLREGRGSWRWTRSYPFEEDNLGPFVQQVHRHLLADLSPTVNIDLGARVGDGTLLDAMTGDERLLRNVWEVVPGYSRYLERRGAAEEAMGYPASVKRTTHASGIYRPGPGLDAWDESFNPAPADRADLPNYAALTSRHRPRGLGLYGNAVFHLKHELLERATFTPGDSFSPGRQGARSVTGSGNLLPLLNHGPDRLVRLAFAEATGFRYDEEFRLLRDAGELERHLVGFFEVQLHGGVRWEDVERVVLVREGGTPAQQQKARLEQFAQEAGHGFTVEILEPGAVRPTGLAPKIPAGDGTLVSAHTGATAPDDVFTTHTSVAGPTPARGKVASGTHVTVEEESVPVRTPEAAGTAHADLAEAFEAVRRQHPDALVHTGRWTMWGHDGDTPHTSAYAIENGSLGLRGVFMPPAADGGVGAWHWHLPGQSRPVAVTPLRLPTSAAPSAATATPARVAAEAAGPLVSALETAAWSAGLHWRADDEELYVFAGTGTGTGTGTGAGAGTGTGEAAAAGAEHPAAVFADGLRPPGDRLLHVAVHTADGAAPDSAWLTATRKIGWLREQAAAVGDADAAELLGRYGWRYDIAAPGGVDVDATLDLAAPHPERAEVLYPGGVDGRHIRGAQRLDGGRAVGPYVTNPGFVEPGRPAATEGTGR